jgi:hypothetical protein
MAFEARVFSLLCVATLLSQPDGVFGRQSTSARPPAQANVQSPMTARGSLELTDPAGDVQPIVYLESEGSGPEKEVKYPGFDVLKLVVASDGTTLNFAATLKAPPAHASYEVLEFYVDADNNSKTGVTLPDDPRRLAGVEFYGTLEDCLEHRTFGTMCAGADPQPAGHSAIVTLEKYGKEWMFKDALLSLPASGAVKEPKKVPVTGAFVQASVPYAAMGLKAGQTIRLVVREACAGKVGAVTQGFFPEIVLTLK